MAPSTESYAQSLRVIGQALETLRISAFTLEKNSEKYIVRDWEPSFLKSISDKVWGKGDSGQTALRTQNSSDRLVYTRADTERLELQGRSRRGSRENRDISELSSALRVVGDYLDTKEAVAFDIWWSIDSVSVKYERAAGDPEEINFTVENLQDLAVSMYMRRSIR